MLPCLFLLPLLLWCEVCGQCTDTLVLNMADMQQTIINFNATITAQNEKIEQLTNEIHQMKFKQAGKM